MTTTDSSEVDFPTIDDENSQPADDVNENTDIENLIVSLPNASSGSTLPSLLFNLVNTTVGAGILAIPYAFRESGIVLGPLLLVVIAAVSYYTLYILISSAEETQAFSYRDMATKLLNHKLPGILFELVGVLFCFGALVSFCVILGQFLEIQTQVWLLQYVGGETWWTKVIGHRSFVMAVCMLLFIYPLCVLRHIHFLSYTSFVSILSVVFVVIVVIVRHVQSVLDDDIPDGRVRLFGDVKSVFTAFPIICFAMASHMTALPMYASMRNRSVRPMRTVSLVAVMVSISFYLVVGIFGYLTFRHDTLDNILNNYDPDDILATAARLCISLVIVLSYPLIHFSCRDSIENILFAGREYSTFRWILEASIICGLAYLLAVVVPDLQTIFGIVGSTTGSLIVFTLPCLLYFFVAKNKIAKGMAGVMLFLSILMGIASTVTTVLTTFRII